MVKKADIDINVMLDHRARGVLLDFVEQFLDSSFNRKTSKQYELRNSVC